MKMLQRAVESLTYLNKASGPPWREPLSPWSLILTEVNGKTYGGTSDSDSEMQEAESTA